MDEDVSAIRDYVVTCGVEEVSVSSLTNLARLLKLELEHPNWATPRQGESNVRTYESWSSPHFAKILLRSQRIAIALIPGTNFPQRRGGELPEGQPAA